MAEEGQSESSQKSLQRSSEDEGSGRSSRFTMSSRVEPVPSESGDLRDDDDLVDVTPRKSRSPIFPFSIKEDFKNPYVLTIVLLLVVAILLIIILIPLGYANLEYYEMGFVHNKATGYVDTSVLYEAGRHWIGVGKNFIIYPASLVQVFYNGVPIYNKEKVEVSLTFSMCYQLRMDDLAMLQQTYGTHRRYQMIVNSTILSALKGDAVKYSISEYRLERPKVAKGLSDAIALVLGGVCCERGCVNQQCRPGCLPTWKCGKRDKGYFAVLKYFQLHRVDVTEGQSYRFMKQALEIELEETERYTQEEMVVRMQTEQMKLNITNEVSMLVQNSTGESSVIRLEGVAEAARIVSYYRSQGLRLLYDRLNVTEEEHKKSLDYVLTLQNVDKVELYFGFQYLVANPANPVSATKP